MSRREKFVTSYRVEFFIDDPGFGSSGHWAHSDDVFHDTTLLEAMEKFGKLLLQNNGYDCEMRLVEIKERPIAHGRPPL